MHRDLEHHFSDRHKVNVSPSISVYLHPCLARIPSEESSSIDLECSISFSTVCSRSERMDRCVLQSSSSPMSGLHHLASTSSHFTSGVVHSWVSHVMSMMMALWASDPPFKILHMSGPYFPTKTVWSWPPKMRGNPSPSSAMSMSLWVPIQ